MKKLLTIALLLSLSSQSFGANFITRVCNAVSSVCYTPLVVEAYRGYLEEQIRFKKADLEKLKVDNPQLPSNGASFVTRGVQVSLSDLDAVKNNPAAKLAFDTLPQLEAKLAKLPSESSFFARYGKEQLMKSDLLLAQQILCQMPGTDAHKNEQIFPHIAMLTKRAGLLNK